MPKSASPRAMIPQLRNRTFGVMRAISAVTTRSCPEAGEGRHLAQIQGYRSTSSRSGHWGSRVRSAKCRRTSSSTTAPTQRV